MKRMATYEVSVEGSFRAAHGIRLADGTMEPPHAHLWKVTATFRAESLDEASGVVVDFLDARRALEHAAAELEGRDLNALPGMAGGASAERVARFLAGRVSALLDAALYRLEVTEADGCRAAYYPSGPRA